MIFVTVGTHEQQFNRLVQKVDELKRDGVINEEVIIQTGYSTYEPQYCKWEKLIPYKDMVKYVNEARIVITHGGPSSFIMPLQVGKVPIVVPRKKDFDEHVNNHQLEFVMNVANRNRTIIVIDNVDELGDYLKKFDEKCKELNQRTETYNNIFCDKFIKIAEELMV